MILGKFNTLSIRIFSRWRSFLDNKERKNYSRCTRKFSQRTRIDGEAVHFIDPSYDARTSSPWRRSWRRCTENLLLILFIFSTKCLDDIARKTILKRIKRSFVNIFVFFFFFTFPNNILFLTTRIVKFKIKKKKIARRKICDI